MTQTKAETIVFYLDLAQKKGMLSKKDLNKAISNFLSEKINKNTNTTFSIFFYKEDNTPFLSQEMQNIEDLSEIIQDDWKKRKFEESNFENGLFYCLSFLASKAVKAEGSYRVICISDLPSKKSAEYAEALMGLVETVRTFPTFIDIIRVGKEEMYPDDVKLRIVSTITSGGLFYASNPKEFKLTFLGLAKNKVLPDLRGEGGQEIDKDKKKYYENLAKVLVELDPGDLSVCSLCSKEICDFCNNPSDAPKKCPQCNEPFHECCAALYSWKFNIGLKNIFRCPNCEVLIKLDELIVYEINGVTLEKEILTKEELEEQVKDETWAPEEIQEKEEIQEEEIQEREEIQEKEEILFKSETGKNAIWKGKETQAFKKWKKARSDLKKEMEDIEEKDMEKMAYRPRSMGFFGPRSPTQKKSSIAKKKSSIAKKKAPEVSALAKRRAQKRKDASTKIITCAICGKRGKFKEKFCSKCGSPLN